MNNRKHIDRYSLYHSISISNYPSIRPVQDHIYPYPIHTHTTVYLSGVKWQKGLGIGTRILSPHSIYLLPLCPTPCFLVLVKFRALSYLQMNSGGNYLKARRSCFQLIFSYWVYRTEIVLCQLVNPEFRCRNQN